MLWQATTEDESGLEPVRSEREGIVIPGHAKVVGLELEENRTLDFVDPLYGYRSCYVRDIYAVRDLTATEEQEVANLWKDMGKVWRSHGQAARPIDAPVTKRQRRKAAKAGT